MSLPSDRFWGFIDKIKARWVKVKAYFTENKSNPVFIVPFSVGCLVLFLLLLLLCVHLHPKGKQGPR